MGEDKGERSRKAQRQEPAEEFLARELKPLIAEARRQAGLLRQHEAAGHAVERAALEEALHQFRVALRRLRSVLRHLRRVYPAAYPRMIADALGELGDLTNPLRDAHVHAELLSTELGITDVHATTDKRAERMLARLRKRLRHGDLELPLGWLEALLKLPAPRSSTCGAGKLARLAFERESKALGAFIEQPPTRVAEWHRMRIAAKRLRYTLEIFGALIPGKHHKAQLRLAKELQEVLGRLHDGDVLLENLRREKCIAAEQRPQVRELLLARRASMQQAALSTAGAYAELMGIKPRTSEDVNAS